MATLETGDDAIDEDDDALEEDEEAAFFEVEDEEVVEIAKTGLSELELVEEAEAVGLPTGTPRPALMESMRLVYDVVAGRATTDGFGRFATEPPFHLATVSSPIKCRVAPPLLTRRN